MCWVSLSEPVVRENTKNPVTRTPIVDIFISNRLFEGFDNVYDGWEVGLVVRV